MADQNNIYQYPLDESEYKARVTFQLVKSEPSGTSSADSFTAQIKDAENDIKSLQKQQDEIRSDLDTDEKSQAEFNEDIRGLQKQIDELIKSIEVYKGLRDQAVNGTPPTIDISGDVVSLYLPLGLAFRDTVTYENFDLGAVGAGMEAGMGFASSITKGIGSFVSGITGGAGADVAKLAGIQLSSKMGSFGDEARAAQKLTGGVTLNPNSRVLFKQPNIREFSFSFKMIAKSKEESEEINNIIKFLRTELYPDEIKVGAISLGYRFPHKFKIEFEYDGEKIPGLAKIQDCYLRDVSTTYNASQMAFHSDGSFMEVDMTLSFQETKALTRKDIEGGY